MNLGRQSNVFMDQYEVKSVFSVLNPVYTVAFFDPSAP
uniref:Uncharacterized protein n=1 Tax=Rhizophora mucronata TaxID=61149 RepID=A0A2P2PSM4_RHIMU